MPPVGFELTVSAGEWSPTYALDRAATYEYNTEWLDEVWNIIQGVLEVFKNELGGTCSAYGREEGRIQGFGGET